MPYFNALQYDHPTFSPSEARVSVPMMAKS